ncbi:hypothetical protein Aperf_G00000084510 [Anoplocephala perfoliata]
MPPRPTINSTDSVNIFQLDMMSYRRPFCLANWVTPSSAIRHPMRNPNLNEFTQQSRFISEDEARNRSRWYRVNLSGPLKNFPSNLCNMTHITTLVIRSNNLERLPPELGNLRNLMNLDASYNRLRSLPATIGHLIDLRALVLNDNYLTELPVEIGCCFNIRHLDLFNNPLNQATMVLYGEGTEPFIRAMIRHYLDIYARRACYLVFCAPLIFDIMTIQLLMDDGCSTSSGATSTSYRYRTTSDQMSPKSRPRSAKWLACKRADLLVSNSELDYCSSPDSAVATGSESLGSSESIDSLDISSKIEIPPPRTKVPAPSKRRNNRRYRRWCQLKRHSLDSCISTDSSSDNSVKKSQPKVSASRKPVAVIRNTLTCPLIFSPGSYPSDQITFLPYYMPHFPAFPPPPVQMLPLTYLMTGERDHLVPSYSSSSSITIDLTGHNVSYSVENLPPITSSRSESSYLPPMNRTPQPLMEINTSLFRPPYTVYPPQRPTHLQHFPFVYIPAPIRVPRALDPCRSLKTCAVPFSEFSNYINSTPPTRQWRQFGTPSKNGFPLKVMSYNVLSANYATMNQFPYCPSWAIDWEYRRRGILEELRRYTPHVICLQEIDTDQFEAVFQPELAKNNYEGIFVVKTRAHTKDAAAARKVDGCAIFWDSTKFNQVATFKHEFGYSCSHLGFKPSSELIERVMIRDNVAIDVILEVKNSGAANGRRFCVTTGHIHWDPECSDVKLIQTILWTSELWQKLEQLNGTGAARMPVILCGDFNSLPQSGVVEFLSTGGVPVTHTDFLDNGFKYNLQEWNLLDKSTYENNTVRHHFNFDRAYKGNGNDGMAYTNMTYDFKGMIDYVFFSRSSFRLLGSLDQIPDAWFRDERIVGCPHIHIPSDHFSLLVELDLLANPGRGLAISEPIDAPSSGSSVGDSTGGAQSSGNGCGSTASASSTNAAASSPAAANSPKPKGSSGSRQKQGKR